MFSVFGGGEWKKSYQPRNKETFCLPRSLGYFKAPSLLSSYCRSRLADFFTNCQPESRAVSSCLKENYADCLLAYSGLIGKTGEKQDGRIVWFTSTHGLLSPVTMWRRSNLQGTLWGLDVRLLGLACKKKKKAKNEASGHTQRQRQEAGLLRSRKTAV